MREKSLGRFFDEVQYLLETGIATVIGIRHVDRGIGAGPRKQAAQLRAAVNRLQCTEILEVAAVHGQDIIEAPEIHGLYLSCA